MPRVIALDLDEVLGSFVSPLCDFHNEKFGTSLAVSDFHSYRFCEVWGGSDAESVQKVHDFFESRHFARLPVVPGAVEGVSTLRSLGFELVVVTSRQLVIEEATRRWLEEHFPNDTFSAVAFGNHWGVSGRKVSKTELCQSLGAHALVDDSLAYTAEIARAGLPALLFDLHGGYGWNSSDSLPAGVRRVTTWDEAVSALKPLAQ